MLNGGLKLVCGMAIARLLCNSCVEFVSEFRRAAFVVDQLADRLVGFAVELEQLHRLDREIVAPALVVIVMPG